MRITARTKVEAERIIAHVWLVLERTKLPSPKVTATQQSPSLIIELQFEQPFHEELVSKELLLGLGDQHSSHQPKPLG